MYIFIVCLLVALGCESLNRNIKIENKKTKFIFGMSIHIIEGLAIGIGVVYTIKNLL